MRNIEQYVADILESIEKIEEYTEGLSIDDFFNDAQKQDAVLRRLEVIGEAIQRDLLPLKET